MSNNEYKIYNLYNSNIILLCGVPASGKSTYGKMLKDYSEKLEKRVSLISRDDIRFKILDEYNLDNSNYFAKEDEVFDAFVEEINKAIEQNHLTIVDATHINAASRNKILSKIDSDREHYPHSLSIIYFDTKPEVCNERNRARSWKYRVPESTMKRMFIQSSKPKLEQLNDIVKWKFTSITCYEVYNDNYINHINILEGAFYGKQK